MKDHHLAIMLGELETAAKELQASLLSRDTEGIWSNLAKQEQSVGKLDRFHRESAVGLQGETRRNPEIRQLLMRSQAVVQANRALTQRFLDVIDQTLSRLGGDGSQTYSGHGASSVRRAPVLVRQQG